MQHYIEATNSEIEALISEHIHSERDRKILRLKLIDGYTHEKIAEICEMSTRQVFTIVKKSVSALLKMRSA